MTVARSEPRAAPMPTALAATLAALPLAATIAPLAWFARMSRRAASPSHRSAT
jgi:hypothetical protein